MYSGRDTRALPRVGFPIRKSRDQRLVSTSPALIAAAHVLHRLLAPRHPPCALHLLIVKNTVICRYGVFKVRIDRPHSGRSFKTQQRCAPLTRNREAVACQRHVGRATAKRLLARRVVEVDVISRRAPTPDGKDLPSTGGTPTGVIAPVSLERR